MTDTPASAGLPRRRLLKLGAASGALAFAGPTLGWVPTARAAGAPAKPKGQAVIGLSQEPTVFQPLKLHIEVDEAVYMNLFGTLWRSNPDGSFAPDLAAEIPTVENGGVSADGLQWRVKLRPDVKWHDGVPFTAEDVKYNLQLTANPNFLAHRRAGHDLLRDITVVSPTEITWRMERPYASYPAILSWTWLGPKHILEKEADINKPAFAQNPVGTGPFRWAERVPGDHITLAAYEGYHGTGPFLERLVVKYVPDLTVLYTQFQTGDIDYVGLQGISPDHYDEAKTLAGRTVMPVPKATVEMLALNTDLPVFKDRAVREALYAAIDKGSIIDQLYYGLMAPTESYLPQQSWAYNPDLPKQSYDPEKAKAMLDAAGWKPGSDGVREKDGVRLEFTNSTTAGNHIREQAQQLLQQNWGDIGARMTISNLPPAVMWGDYWMLSKFQSAMVGIDFLVGPDPDTTDYFSSRAIAAKGGGGQNTTQFVSPEADALLKEGASTVDRAERKAAYAKLQALVRHELPYLPLFQYAMVQGVKGGLTGFVPNINAQENCWNAGQWSWA
ncbi:MAG: peptide ABC transporter substrate-binding protein [Caulobacteraceae bacterium]|nr:peptide ABC transporter substrate-binding protein [Caulobacter sp.]